jgi:glycine oxidase
MSMQPIPKFGPDVVIAGAGIIGMAIALELSARGVRVTVVERNLALRQASFAAAGMLAVDDPHNPPELLPLAQYSIDLYPEFLRRIEKLSGVAVPYQTEITWQYLADGDAVQLAERSIDPRQLSDALFAAVEASAIQVLTHTEIASIVETAGDIRLRTAAGVVITAQHVVHANGAWLLAAPGVGPRKGQMLRVKIPASLKLSEVHRSESVYVVPRIRGPQAGTAVVGATVEDAGFDTTTHFEDLASLRRLAAKMLPVLGDANDAPEVESWAGLRPATRDGLPLLGTLRKASRQFIAAGHFRNGILLAPATAAIMADLLEGKSPSVSLSQFAPDRFL